MAKEIKNRILSCISMLLSVIMVLSTCSFTVFAEETITQGLWTITNDTASGIATYGNLGFTYYSPTTVLTYGSNGGKDYVRSNNTNGAASNGIVTTDNRSYCDFIPKADGTLTVYVGNASTKTGYVSRTAANGQSEAIGTFVPGGSDNYDSEGFKVTQGTTWATVEIEVESGYTYYIALSGSKMFCYGAEYVAYTNVNGVINDAYNLGSYDIKFTNKETGESKVATVNGNSYSILLKPGYEYSASLSGSNATKYAVSNSTRVVNVNVAESQTANLTIEESLSYLVSGSLTGITGALPADTKLVFVPEDTTSFEEVVATIDTGSMTYSAQLVANEKYTLTLVGAYDYMLADDVAVNNDSSDAVTKDIAFSAVPTYAVSGKFLGLTQVRGQYETLDVNPTSISFKNVEDNYTYTGTVSNSAYSVSLRNGSYLASIVADNYSTSTHVTVNNGAVTRDLLLKDTSPKTVEYKDVIYVGSDKEYKTVQAAVDAVTNMPRQNGERVTIMIDPGTYREQVVIRTPDITLESNGGTREDTKITWYYGIGYKYYSCVNSYYDPYADYDKFDKGNVVSYWGAAVIPTSSATGFRAKDITFENSFNKYMTDEEIEDGVEPNGLESISVQRKENTNVDTRTATERAAALVNYADKTEFLNCSFIGSQDTLYTCNVAYDAYYKNCYIEGQTDFIYGNGDVIFDGCEINFCGYDGTQAGGYLTANSCSDSYYAEDGYIFRSCYVSYSDTRDVTAGSFGRMWGNSAKVAFLNTQLQESDMIVDAGWTAMSVDPSVSTVTLVEYNTTHNGEPVKTSGRVNGVVDSIDADKYTVESVFINKGWTPAYYTGESSNTPVFDKVPSMTSNGDLNTPNPGETITLGYELGSEWADEDASRIAWYAVDTDYDDTSLDTILQSATLLSVESAVTTNKFQIPMECAGKYIMAVVTPITISGLVGETEYIIDTEKPVSDTWSDPDNEGSLAPGSGINVYLAGDSTVKDYSAEGIYNGGKTLDQGSWGEFLQYFFDENYVTVNNYAQGGRSSRSFINEGKLDTILSNIKAGDYLLIQFGHNDCANGASYYEERFAPLYTEANPYVEGQAYPTIVPTEDMKVPTPTTLQSSYGSTYYSWDCGATYKGYIQYYINAALAKGAIPVIVSPVARLYYSSDGTIRTHHDATATDYAPTANLLTSGDAYVTACEELYNENKDKGVLYIDAFNMTKDLYEEAYTAGGSTYGEAIMSVGDKTHSNKTGGVIQAGLLAKYIQDAEISISPYVIQPETVYGENSDGEYIFTIKKSLFTANDNSYTEVSYWSDYGQTLFDSIGGASSENKVTLNFATDEALALYETNAATTFTDGVYSGKYTNSENDKYDVSVYESGILYYNSSIVYGTKAMINKPIFSFTADKAANYKITATASTGSGTIGLYTDSACTNAVATADSTGELVYEKTTDTPEVLYFATPDAGNMYLKEITISHTIIEVAPANKVTLNFATDEALALYETNATDTFTDGVYSGEYTNSNNDKYDVSVYESGILYYNSSIVYGTKAMINKPIFSFTADKVANYTITATASTGSGTIGLYTDSACTNAVATADSTGELVYKKTTDTPEVLYFATSDAGNMYLKEITISHIVPVKMTLNFGTDDALAMYETNAADTFTNGVCTGTYINDDGQSFDVSVYEDAILYYNSTAFYGTKLVYNRALFSFVADEKGMYTINVPSISAGGNTAAGLYSDASLTTSIVEGTIAGTIVYKKTTSTPETVYFGTTTAGNSYIPNITITKSELPDDVKVQFTGEVSGIENDDTNVVITLKGATETLTVSEESYESDGLELIVGETYVVTAKGDKGIYLGTDIVTDDSGIANIVLSRILFDFPFDFVDNYYDYQTYLNLSGYASGDVTDAYSGVTAHRNGIVMTDSYKDNYGVKTNSYSILSFVAGQTGTCTVNIKTSVSNSDNLILKVNDVYVPNLVTAGSNSDVALSVMVEEGDKVTIYTPTRSNLWYKTIDIAYTDASFIEVDAIPKSDNSEIMIYGAVHKEFAANIDSVGFYYTSGIVGDLADCIVADETSTVYNEAEYDGNKYSVADNYIFGTVLGDIAEADKVYVYTFCKTTDGTTYYSAPVEVNLK